MNLMIRPLIPNFSVLSNGSLVVHIDLAILLTGIVFVAVLLSYYAADRFKGNEKKTAF